MKSRTFLALLVSLTLVLAACGNDDAGADGDALDGAAAEQGLDDLVDDAVADELDDSDDEGDGSGVGGAGGTQLGDVIDATIRLGGPVSETYFPDENTDIVVAGGCQGDVFTLQIQVRGADGETLVDATAAVPEDLSGGATGSYDIDDFEVDIYPGGDSYEGFATVSITNHDATATDRKMVLSVIAPILEGPGGSLNFTTDLQWAMGCL